MEQSQGQPFQLSTSVQASDSAVPSEAFGEGPFNYMNPLLRAIRMKRSMMVPLSDIVLLDRGRKDMGDIEDMKNSLLRHGQIQPIVVRNPRADELDRVAGKPWILVAGGRRYAGAALLAWDTIHAIMLEDMPAWRQRAIELEENLKRKSMNFDEEVRMKAEVHELYQAEAATRDAEWTQRDTARELGESVANLNRDLKLAEAMKKDPSLAKSSSKKAAVRAVELREHVRMLEAAQQVDTTNLRNRLITARAEQWLATLETASVDLVFTDPPYGIDYGERPTGASHGLSRYDDSRESALATIRAVVPDLLRITKPTGWLVMFMNWELYNELKESVECTCTAHYTYGPLTVSISPHGTSSVTLPERCPAWTKDSPCTFIRAEALPWMWYRPNSRNNPEHPHLHAQNRYELILVVNRGEARLITSSFRQVPNVRVADCDYSERIHAMEKPLSLCSDIVEEFSLAGQLVVDPFFGSGKLLMGAAMLGREFQGCDQNPDLLESAIASIAPYWSGSQLTHSSSESNDDENE